MADEQKADVVEYIFDTPGTYYLDIPSADLIQFEAEATGAGGGGGNRTSIGSAGGGGGGSFVAVSTIDPTECATLQGFSLMIEVPAGGANGVNPSNTIITFGAGITWPYWVIAASGKSVATNSINGAQGGAIDTYEAFTDSIFNVPGHGANGGSTYGGGGGEAGGRLSTGASGNTYIGGNGSSEGGAGGNGATSHSAGNAGGFPGGGGGGARMVTTGARELKGGVGGNGKVVIRFYIQSAPPTETNEILAIIEM